MFFVWWFPPFCKHKKGPSTSTKDFLIKKTKTISNLNFFNEIILQWVLGLVTKTWKYFNKFIPLCTWLNRFVDDIKEHTFEKMHYYKMCV
jgi:hypothetical protein